MEYMIKCFICHSLHLLQPEMRYQNKNFELLQILWFITSNSTFLKQMEKLTSLV